MKVGVGLVGLLLVAAALQWSTSPAGVVRGRAALVMAAAPYPILGDAWDGHDVLVWGGRHQGDPEVGVFDPAEGRWLPTPQPVLPAVVVAGGWTGRELLVVDQLGDAAAYDPARRRWRPLPAAPDRRPGVWEASTVMDGGLVTLHSSQGVARLDPDRGWARLPDLPASAGVAHSATPVLTVAGGELVDLVAPPPATPRASVSIERLTRGGGWESTEAPPVGVVDGTPVPVGGRLIVWRAAHDGEDGRSPRAASWDPGSGTWTVLPPSPVHGAQTVAGVVADHGSLVVVGEDIHRRPIVASYTSGQGWLQTPAPAAAELLRALNRDDSWGAEAGPAVLAGRRLVLFAEGSSKTVATAVVDLDGLNPPAPTTPPAPPAQLEACRPDQLIVTLIRQTGSVQHTYSIVQAANISGHPCRLDSPIRLTDRDLPDRTITIDADEDALPLDDYAKGPSGTVGVPAGGTADVDLVVAGQPLCSGAGEVAAAIPHALLAVNGGTVPVSTRPVEGASDQVLSTCGSHLAATPWLAQDWTW